ncbi:hypothetical protein ONE63_001895 [Megalurothrips usitatus]|uniref:Kinesin-like protein n=1 Tax=Megalurothrips usitatus TaxID=439358 RepID=A0AAV7XE64_9NEOP|nr:hypothetical protein ONE63_001895 [Megalurothrips usitatus]
MVKNPIKVYGRIKPVLNKNQAEDYEINRTEDDFETISFNRSHEFSNAKPESITFRFQKVFNTSNQEDVFNEVAKPVVDSVLHGYNGTIFAYGQTGSGKTYSMTGGLSRYEDRGVIPRTIQHIFKHYLEAGVTHSTFISYLEIYNECGYDLLNPNHKMSKLDDLTKVVLMEDTSGTTNLRNLSLHPVSSEEEALNLLFLGDTNRMISETPLNPSSSRSHCVFTVHVVTRSATSSAVRRSKLHLIDLAGSERVHKTGIDGALLTEARYINLSLHYLEQVIVALADSRRSHVPYRNSMMTTVLRDSLGGNCMTAMLATLSSNKNNIDETLSTCRFAQRVALVRNEALLNEEKDPHQEIALLRADVRRLKDQIAALTAAGSQVTDELTEAERAECRAWVLEYLRRDVDDGESEATAIDVTSAGAAAAAAASPRPAVAVPSDPRKVRLCFAMLRDACCQRDGGGAATPACEEARLQTKVASQVEHFREIIRQRDSEISILINLLRKEKQRSAGNASPASPGQCPSPQDQDVDVGDERCTGGAQAALAQPAPPPPSPTPPAIEYEPVIQRLTGQNFTLAEREAFKIFAGDRKNRIEVEMTKEALKAKFEEARLAAARIKLTRKKMVSLHNEMKLMSDLEPTQRARKAALQAELSNEQASYKNTLMNLQLLKVETGHQKHAVEQAKLRLLRKFQDWWAAQVSCCSAFSASNPVPGETLPAGRQDPAGRLDVEANDPHVETLTPPTPPRPHSCQEPRSTLATAAQRQLQVRFLHQ